jgi:ATP-dependent Clp protease ATP-binding subunit ClpA/protein subunit release factor A
MNDEIRSLLDSLRRGQYEDPSEKIALLAAALQEGPAEESLIEGLLRAPQIPLRLAALEACRLGGPRCAELTLVMLSGDAESRVRLKLLDCLPNADTKTTQEILTRLMQDTDDEVRCRAVKASEGRPVFADSHTKLLESDPHWSVRRAAAKALGESASPTRSAASGLIKALISDSDEDVQTECARQLDRLLELDQDAATAVLPSDIQRLAKAEAVVAPMGERFKHLLEWLHERTSVAANPRELARFGTDLTALAHSGLLPRAHHIPNFTATLVDLLKRERRRSIALIGKSGCGKSAIVQELVHALALPENGAWLVIRVSPSDLISGTRFLGEWETKVRELVAAARFPRRVLIYVPNLGELSSVGRSSKSDSNIASALAPYLDDGSIVLLGEATPEEFERGMGREASLVRLFDKVLVEEASMDQTEAILRAIREEEGARVVPDERLSEILELSGFFMGHLAAPGNAATLLRSVIAWARAAEREATRLDILSVISQSSGLPIKLLDDTCSLDQRQLREFFENQIIGQPEAVEAVVDVVTLIKAGLTDPARPFNVMLFVGPTGVGKTELARALASYIFGNPDRLLRFDMSEFAGPEGFNRLIGGREDNGILTDAIRQRPFSVLLLDEIEKSHVNVFDLCLQIFDAGRLTDGRGRLVDFRRTVVILTSNVGAAGLETRLGFGTGAEDRTAGTPDPDRTLRELSRVFRPEFLNRIDRIVNFRPLSLEVAERIARRELQQVLLRSGILRRGLTINTDSSVISLLVREGYSPHFGARPLKRTVERHVLLPLARFIAANPNQEAAVLSLVARGNQVDIHLLSTPTPPSGPGVSSVSTSSKPQKPSVEETPELLDRIHKLEGFLEPLTARKSELMSRTRERGFFDQKATREAVLEELHRLDEFLARCAALREGIDRFSASRAVRSRSPDKQDLSFEERKAELRSELEQLELVCRSAKDTSLMGDALLLIMQVKSDGDSLDAVRKLAETYGHIAARRRLRCEVIAERWEGQVDEVWLRIPGLGARALFVAEEGLHEFNHRRRSKNPRSGREQTFKDTTMLRVEVFPGQGDPDRKFMREVDTQVRVSALKPPRSRMVDSASWSVRVFHPPTLRSIEVWTAGTKDQAMKTACEILYSQVRSAAPTDTSSTRVVRRYDLGIGSRIKDLRTGRITTRLAQFFRGKVDLGQS